MNGSELVTRRKLFELGLGYAGSLASAELAQPSSKFLITYEKPTPDDVKLATQAAASLWEETIVSPIPIKMRVIWESFGGINQPKALGAPTWVSNFPNAPLRDVEYPLALANTITGVDLQPQSSAIHIWINSDLKDQFYTGLDGNVPAGKTSLRSLMLHEIGHGLGMLGFLGINEKDGLGYKGPGKRLFDFFVVDRHGELLLQMPDGSTKLRDALWEGAYFKGPHTVKAAGELGASLEPQNPAHYMQYEHLAQLYFGTNVMANPPWGAEVGIGPVDRAIFKDMGYQVTTIFQQVIAKILKGEQTGW